MMLRCWYICLILFAPRLLAIDVTLLNDAEALPLGLELDIWNNRGEPAKEDEVLAGKFSEQFVRSQVSYPSAGFSHGEFWARLTLSNPGKETVTLWLESRVSLIDRVSFFAADATGSYRVRHQGDKVDFAERETSYRMPAFALSVYPGTHNYYIRTTTAGSNMLALFLWKPQGFDRHQWLDTSWLTAMLGVLAAMLIYNGFLALSLHSNTYNYYTIFLFLMTTMQVCMQGIPPLIFENKTSEWLMNDGFIFSANLTGIFAIQVTISFLNMKQFMPRWHSFCRLLLLIPVGIMIAGFFVPYNTFAALSSNFAGLYCLALIAAAVVAVGRGYRPARFYCLAWLFVLGATVLNTLHYLGVVHPSFIVQFNSLPGAVLEGLLMSLALADRVNFTRNKAEKTIRNLNSDLSQHLLKVEKIVEERTQTIRLILDHVTSGLLIVDRSGVVQSGYSQSCHELLNQEKIHEEMFFKLIDLNHDEARQFRMAFEQIFSELMPLDVCFSQLPKFVKKNGKILKLGANAVPSSEGTLQHVLFTIQDVTELHHRQSKSRHDRLLIRILRDRTAFRHFIGTSYDVLQKLKRPLDSKTAKFLLHTLKGNSQVFRLAKLARTIHEAEEAENIGQQDILQIEEQLEKFLAHNEKLLKVSWGPQKEDLTLSLDNVETLVQMIQSAGNETLAMRVQTLIDELRQPTIETLLRPMVASCQMTAKRLGKSVDIRTDGGSLRTRCSQESKIIESLIHFLRNAVVHGIEQDREQVGKPKSGLIEVTFTEEAESLHIRCRDDGQGFLRKDWEEAGRRLLSLSASAASAMKLQDLVFEVAQLGFSTRTDLNLDAGRGIGLGGLVQLIREYGGRMELQSEDGIGTCFDIYLPRNAVEEVPSKPAALSA